MGCEVVQRLRLRIFMDDQRAAINLFLYRGCGAALLAFMYSVLDQVLG